MRLPVPDSVTEIPDSHEIDVVPDTMAKKNPLTHGKKQRALALLQQGKLAEAKPLLEQICRTDRADTQALFQLGVVYGMAGQHDQAEHAFRQILRINPQHADASNNLGLSLEAQGQSQQAVTCFENAVRLVPNNPEFHFNLAYSLDSLQQYDKAIAHYQQAIQLNPAKDVVYTNLGHSLLQQGDRNAAVAACQKAIQLNPASAHAYNNLGNALKEDDGQAAERAYVHAVLLNPGYADAYYNLGILQQDQGRIADAIKSFRQAYVHGTTQAKDLSCLLFAMNYLHTAEELFKAHQEYNQLVGVKDASVLAFPNVRDSTKKIRLGYLSPDFRQHSVAYFIEPVLANHNHQQFEIFCYANSRKVDAVTARLQACADHWCEIATLSDAAVLQQIRTDGIDILVDLAGHSLNNRLLVFAHKPAPVQVTYLGYPNTTGLTTIDYRLTDVWADPPGQEQFHSETLWRLPTGFLCYRPAADAPQVSALSALTQGYVTFGSFNVLPKIGAEVIAVWAMILRAVPASRLLLKNRSLHDAVTCQRIHQMFAEHGIAPERIELIGRLEHHRDHLALYQRIDIGLDPFPYNGTTTTCEALWMGVPVLTLAGQHHAGRVGVSLMQQTGLVDWIASAPDDYVARAVAFATDLTALAALRAGLRETVRTSPLLAEAQFTQSLELAYQQMWAAWCRQGVATAPAN